MSGEQLEPVAEVEAETVEDQDIRGIVKYASGDGLDDLETGTPLFTAAQIRNRIEAIFKDVLENEDVEDVSSAVIDSMVLDRLEVELENAEPESSEAGED